MAITATAIDAIKVQFVEPIFEEDFVEKGMTAWLTDVQWDEGCECYKLFFDFEEFEDINRKYFKAVFHPNCHTKELEERTGRKLFTAVEAGWYEPKYTVYFSCGDHTNRDDEAFTREITRHLREVE